MANVTTKTAATVDDVERLYLEATGSWAGADWTHDWRPLTTRVPLLTCTDTDHCDGSEPCQTCAAAERDATAAEDEAAIAMERYRCGDLEGALAAATRAQNLEGTYGDSPTWGALRDAISAEVEAAEEGEES